MIFVLIFEDYCLLGFFTENNKPEELNAFFFKC